LNSTASCFNTVRKVLENLPVSWVELTTHRLDIYDEEQAKSQFLEQLQALQATMDYSAKTLEALPSAYDYIRLGHQLSSVLEWVVAEINQVPSDQVITFISKTMPILAVIRKNTLSGVATYVYHDTDNSPLIDIPRLEQIYGYKIHIQKVANASEIPSHNDATVLFVTESPYKTALNNNESVTENIDATINIYNISGQLITASQLKNRSSTSIAIPNYKGAAIVSIVTSGQTINKKVILW